MNTQAISVEEVYALPDKHQLISVTLEADSTAQDAIVISNIPEICPEIDFSINNVGVLGRE